MDFVAAVLGAVKAIRFLEGWLDAFSAPLLRLAMLGGRLAKYLRWGVGYLDCYLGERGRRKERVLAEMFRLDARVGAQGMVSLSYTDTLWEGQRFHDCPIIH